MGIFKRQGKKGGTWYADYYRRGKRHIEAVGPNKKEAQEFLGKKLREIRDEEKFGRRPIKRVTIEDFATDYLRRTSHLRSQVTLKYGVQEIERHFAGRYVCDLTEKDVDDFILARRDTPTRWKRERSGAAVNRIVNILSAMLSMAVRLGMAEKNVASRCRRLKENRGRLRYLSVDEAARVLELARKSRSRHLYAAVLLALETGMRRGEILTLRWEDVDFQTGQIWIRESKNGTPRHVPMTASVREVLSKHPRHVRTDFLFPGYAGPQFSGGANGPVTDSRLSNSIREIFANLMQRAGIQDFRFHDLRHTFASHLVMRGVPLHTVGQLLGHRTPAMTMRYAHLSPGHLKDSVGMLPRWELGDKSAINSGEGA